MVVCYPTIRCTDKGGLMALRRVLFTSMAAALAVPMLVMSGASAARVDHGGTPMPAPGVATCDSLVSTPVGHDCLLPWPNNAFTKPASTATGLLVNIAKTATPMNKSGVHINPTFENQNDGFSPGSVVMIQIPNLSLANSAIATSSTEKKWRATSRCTPRHAKRG